MEQNDKNLQGIYNTLKKEGYNPPAYDVFVKDMQDDNNLQGVRNTLVKHGYTPPEFAEFKADMFGVPAPQQQAAQATTAPTSSPVPVNPPIATADQASEPAQSAPASASQPQQPAWQPTEQDKIRTSYQLHTMLNDFNKRSKERIAQVRRMAEPLTAEGRKKREALEFQARLAGAPTKVMGLAAPTPAPAPDGAQGDVGEAAQPQQIQSGQSPVPYGVRYVDGKAVTQWLLPDGSLTTDLAEADRAEWNARTARLHRRADASMDARIKQAEAELAELEKQYQESSSRVHEEWAEDYKKNTAPLAAVLASGTYAPRQQSDKENSALRVAIRQKEEQIKDLKEERDRRAGKDVGFWRGFGRTVSDVRTWDFGIGDLSDAMTMLDAGHYSSSKVTEGERKAGEAMMKAVYDKQETEKLYSGNASWWNRAGGMTGHMPAFMLDFAFTGGGYGSVAKVGAKTAAKQSAKMFSKKAIEEMAELGVRDYAKKYGVRGVGRMAGNWTVKALGTTADDLLVRAPLMTNTVQGGKTAADIIDRKLGDVRVDEDGNYDFSDDKTWGSAVWQGEANSIIENYSEMFGTHIDGLTPMLAKTFGGKRISGMLARTNASGFGRVLDTTRKQFQHLGVSDYFGEVAEEYYGQLWRTMLNLDDAYTNVPVFDAQGNPMIDEQGNPITERKNLLFTGQFHGDIWGGMALSMGLMGAGKYTLTGVGYANMKREVNKADRTASQILGHDEWETLRETIDNTTNEDMGTLAECIIDDSKLSVDELAAIMGYMERSLNLRGLNLATLAQNRGAETDEPVALEDVYEYSPQSAEDKATARLTPEQAEAQSRYEQGRELFGRYEDGDPTAQADADAIALRMQEAYQAVEDVFGAEAEYYMFHVNEHPWDLLNDPELTIEQKDAVLYYINAKAALDGAMDASNEAADSKRAEVEESVAKRTHKDNGVIIPATMKVDDRQVYVVKGDVVMFPDGSAVDVRNSSESVVVMDAQTGEYQFTSPDQIFQVSEAVNPKDELDAALSVIEQERMNMFSAMNDLSKEQGDLPVDDGDNAVAPEVSTEAGPASEAPASAGTEEYDRGYERGLEEAAKADDAWIANLIKIYSQNTPESMSETMKGQLDAYIYEQQRRAQAVHENAESVPNPTENPVSGAETAPETVPNVENGQQTALSRIPLNEKGEPSFEAVDKETAWDGLVEAVGGEADAVDIAMAQVQQATADLEALKKKPPTQKAPKLKGSPMAMAQAKREAAEQYQRDLDQYNQQIADTQAHLDAWNGIVAVHNSRNAELRRRQEVERRQRDAIAHDEAVARFEAEQRIKAEKQAEQERIGVHAVNPKIKGKWDAAPKVEGNADAITLPDGSTVRGRYVLTEAGAASASHDVNNAYMPTEGFPIDENGQSVNDRDYMRDKDAQRIVEQMAGAYDNRALQTPVIVSKDGMVLSGNNRTMSGDLAARQGTDKAYVDYLREFGHKYGFTPEQVQGMSNPRLVFVPDENLPYDATTFSRFNAQEMKSQSKPEAAVKLGKIVPDNVFTDIVTDISRYDRLSDYYADEKAVAHALGALMQAGVINDKQMPEMRTGTALSAAGKELIENTLIGKVFQASPDAVRQIISVPTLRQSIVMGLSEIANNRTLSRNGYDISDELSKAVDLVARAKTAMPDIYTDGMPVSPFGRMQGLFDDEFGDSRVTDATTLLLADILNSGRPSDLRKILTTYNNEASQASGGQMDMFSGSIPTKEEILTTVNEHFRNATPKEQQALVDAAIAERKRRAEADAEQRERSEASGQIPHDDERRAEPQQPVAGDTELESLGKDRNDLYEDTPEEAALRARISVGEEWEEQGPAPDKPIYKRKLYVDGKHEVIQTDAPDKNGSYTGSQLTFDGRNFGDLKEIADYIDGGMQAQQAEPTEAQKAAGNYKMEHRRVDGYNISIENAKGSVRRGTGSDGKPWETTMQNDYGYIRGTEGVDGDHIDVFLSDTPEEGDVFVVDQVNEDGSFDEHKVMYGFPTEQAARDAYLSNYEPGWTGLGAITHVSKDEFKKWIQSSRRKTKPFAEYKSVKPIVGNDMIGRSLTEQEATELIARMEATAEVAPTIELTPENWIAQFGEDGTVETPIGIVKMGANQLLKLYSTKRTGYFGMIHPTLSTPDVILEEADPKEGSERDSKYLFVKTFVKSDGSRIVHFESVTVKKDGMEVSISSHEIKDKSLKNKMQNDIVLHLDEKLSPSSEMRLTEAPSESEGPDLVPTSDNVISSDRKVNTLSADKQAESTESSEPYTITPTTYTNKKGKTSDVHLVKFNRELTAEEKAALDTFAREPLTEGKKTSRGWYDRKQGGYMMRSEEAARQLGAMLGDEEAVADAQPLSREDIKQAAMPAEKPARKKPAPKPANTATIEDLSEPTEQKKVEYKEGDVVELTTGDRFVIRHIRPDGTMHGRYVQSKLHGNDVSGLRPEKIKRVVETSEDKPAPADKPKGQFKVTDEMKAQEDELRKLLGIDDDEGSTDSYFRDPDELTPEQKRKVFSLGVNYAFNFLDNGVTTFPDFAKAVVGRLGSKVKPFIKSWYEGAKRVPGYGGEGYTDSADVDRFDIENFDKPSLDAIRDAEMRVAERKAKQAAEQAEKELIAERNEQRKKDEQQTAADTATLAEKAEAVASEAESHASLAGGRKPERKTILRDLKRVDDTIDEVNDQLAILGYYEAEEVDKDFNEAYGYMRNAEKKAVKDAVDLAKQLVSDLDLGLDKVTGATTANRGKRKNAVTANIAPAGGYISIRLPLNEGRELYVAIGLDPSESPGDVTRSGDNLQATRIMYRVEWPDEKGHVSFDRMGRNCWADANVTYADLLKGIQREVKDYLPSTPAESEGTHNGYKIGDEVMWDRYGNDKWEKVKIEDFDTDGSPIFEAVKGVMSEKGDWSRVKPADGIFGEAKRVARAAQEKRRARVEQGKEKRQKQTAFSHEGQDLTTSSASVPDVDTGAKLVISDKSAVNPKKSRKKDATLKPEQPVGDLFGGLFDNPQNSSNHEEIEMGTRPGEAGGQRQQLKQDTQVGGDESRRETERPAGEAGSGSAGMDSDADRAGGRGLHDVAAQPALERLPEKERKNVHNNHVERGTEVAPKSESARIKANIAAIETMKKLEASGEAPTAADMKKLRAFSGWGGLGKAFSDRDTSRQLRQLLGDKLYDEGAEMSRNSAYFTPTYIVDAMWDIARAMGFNGGRVLEGSAGIGNVLGLMPQDLSERSDIRAVEKDPTTGKMLSLLYPDAVVDIDGFEKVKIETGTYDLVITNVPFVPGLKVADTSGDADISKEFKAAIHDFCIAKSVRKLRDGGIGVFITTAGSMDGTGRLYKWLANRENADIVGMFRMHNETFGGTNATSDIIVVRKRVNGVKSPHAIDCSLTTGVRTAEYDTGETRKVKNAGEVPVIKTLSMSYNRYYVEHPEYMAGEMHFGFEKGDTGFRPESKGLYPVKEKDQSQLLSQWVEDMRQRFAGIPEEAAPTVMNHRDEYVPTYDKVGNEVKTGTIVVDSQGRICVNYDGTARPLMSKLDNKSPKSADERIAQFNKNKVKGRTRAQVVQDYNAIKKALNELLEYQKTSDSDDGLQPKLKALNRAFDFFVATYGHLHGNNGLAWLKNDVDYPSVLALETYREEGLEHKKIFGKADIFSRRVVVRTEQPTATNVRDGVTLSIRQTGSLDTRYIAEQLGMNEADVRREVIEAGLGYENPLTHSMEAAHEYLSGNVREKMQQAEANNEDGRYTPNIAALHKVVPHDIPAHFIEFSIGSSWMRPELFEQYVKERTGASVKLTYAGGMWVMDKPRWTGEQDKSFGIRSEICDKVITGTELIEAAMTNRTIRVSKQQKDGPAISDPKATSACAAKVDEIRDDFKSWMRSRMESDPKLAKEIEEAYNDIFNNSAPMTIPDEYIPEYFDGAARVVGGKHIKMREHQAKAVVRGTMQSLMLAHEVGTGKTYTLITTAMEMRRLGTAKKPMIVAQNATLGQFVASAKALYPDARILSLEDSDRNAEGRKDFYAKIRYNDWDMVVIPQSVLERIPDHPDRERRFIEESIQEKMEVIEVMSKDREAGRSVAALKKEVENLRDQLNNLSDAGAAEGAMDMPGSKSRRDGKRAAIAKENAQTRAEEMLSRATDDTLNFDDLGVDAILVDEAHEYKHLGFATAMQRGVKGVDPSYSKKCQGLYLKVKAVQEKSGGRNVIFATGTPISNTAAEVWTFMRYLLPREVMEGHNIWHFDDFVRNFGSIQQMLEFTTQGTYKENNRFAGYSNLPELARIWAGIADTVLTAEAGEVKSQIPELEGGQPTDIYLPQTNGLRAVLKFVRAQLKAYDEMSGQEKKENSHIPLVMYGIAKAAAIDARLVMANAPDDPHSKTNEAVRQTLRSLEDSKAYNGTVAIFADNYQRKNKETGAVEFNLFDDIRNKLIAQGVPAEQVVIMRDGMTDKAKEKIFAKINAGEIRVILGTTQRLGVGVNIQERLHTLMHIDAPNRPMDYWQRMGRLLRQGNMHKEMGIPVRVIRFGVEDSLDVTAYQRLKTKGAIADAIMHSKDLLANNLENRILEEEGDEFGNITAELSGSQYAMLQNQTEKELRKLQAKQDQHRQHQMYIHRTEPRLREAIERYSGNIVRSDEILALLENNPTTITINGKTYQSREDMQKVFEAHNKSMAAKKQSVRQNEPITSTLTFDVGNIHFTLETNVGQVAGYGGQGSLAFDTEVRHRVTSDDIDFERSFGDIPLKRIINELVDNVTSGKEERTNREGWVNAKERAETDLAALLKDKDKPFEHSERIKELEQKLEEYTTAMQEELKEKEAKYAEMDANIEDATDITFTAEDDEDSMDTPTNGDGNKYRDGDGMSEGERLRAIRALKPVEVKRNDMSKAELREIYNNLPSVEKDGREIEFYRSAFKKIYKEGGLFGQVVPVLDEVLEKSVLAYSEEDNIGGMVRSDGTTHKSHPNVESFDNYVGKVNIDGRDYFVRTTIKREIGHAGAHSYFVSAVDVYEKTVAEPTLPNFPSGEDLPQRLKPATGGTDSAISRRPKHPCDGVVDAKLQQFFERASSEANILDMRDRVEELSKGLNTPVRIVTKQSDVDNLPSTRHRRAKGYFDPATDEVVIVVPNNRDVADVDNTFVHEVVGHKGLRALVGEERFDEFLGEIYDHASNPIRKIIDKMTDRMVGEETDRLRVRKAQAHERAGEDVNANYYTDMAEARVEAEKKREEFRREATEEYMADLGGRIGSEGFEKMSRDELTLWGKIKAKVQAFLDKFLRGLKIAKNIRLSDKDLAYILYKSWKNLRDRKGKGGVFADAEDAVMRRRTGWDEPNLREMSRGERARVRAEAIADRIEDLFDKAVKGDLTGKPIEVGRLTSEGKAYLEKLSGVKLKEKVSFVLNPSDLMHIYRRHFGTNEKDGRNIPLTQEDIRRMAEIISTPDRVVFGKEIGGNERNMFFFLKETTGGSYNLMEVYSDKRGNLTAKSFFKSKEGVSQRAMLLGESSTLTSITDGATLFGDAKLPKFFEYPTSEREELLRFRDPGLGLEETITKMKAEAMQANAGNLQAKRDAMRAIGGNLNHLRQAMARQREYDITTVKSVADLARVLIDNNLLDDLSKYETKRILGAINNVVGKKDVSQYVQKVMDIMVDNQLRMGANTLGRLLSIRGSRVDARGIKVQGELDPEGQRIAQILRKSIPLPKDDIDNRIAEAINRMSSTDQAIADEATIEYVGLQIAHQYVEDITESKAEEKALRDSIREAKEAKDAGQMTDDAYRQYVESTEDAIRQNKLERAEAFHSLVEQVGGVLSESVSRAKAWREEQKQRVEEIHHNANSDMEGRPTDEHHKDDRVQKFINNDIARFLLAPLATFDQMLRMFGRKNSRGEGYLWNRYMRGWVTATEKEYTGYRDALKALDAKVSEIYGKDMTWGDLFAIDRKLPKASVRFFDGGEMKDHELTQGNLLYIYMADKMSDGRMKLRRMGITEKDIEDIKNFLDPKFTELADWMQEEFLVDKRNEYNEVHKRMFGASMAAIENYFPLKILANARLEDVDVADDAADTALPATSTGSIIKRRRNSLALDVTGANAFSVILDHLQQMERWAAFAEFNRDLNTLLSYKRFRNQVMNMSSVYGAGKTLWNNFRNVCKMAAGTYRPPIAALDKLAVNIAKGATAAKVNSRVFTALKQFLSMPAYVSDSNPAYLAVNIIKPHKAWMWSMENLPLFEKRWRSRMAGDPRLLKSEMDWKMWRNHVFELASRVGMTPNAFVDALTVAIGAHAMYQTKLAKYKRQGYDPDVAEERAKQDATILFNQTQQSSEGAFLSTMQVDRSWLSVLFTVFRNSSMSYTRQLYDSIRNIGRRLTPGYKALSEEFMAKQMRRDGIDPDKADRNAKQEYRRGIIRDLVRVGVFGYVLQLAWNLGAYLPYLIFGDDDDEKDKMWDDVFTHPMFGSIEGLTGGDVYSNILNTWAKGEKITPWVASKDMPLASDLENIWTKWNTDEVSAMNDVINLLVQSGVGVNPQSLTDAVVAVLDVCGDDAQTSRECALLIARVINCPQSQLDKIYFDELDASGEEASRMTPSEIAERYAEYKMMREAPLTGWLRSDEAEDSIRTQRKEKVLRVAKERINNNVATERTKQLLSEYDAVAKRQTEINKLRKTDRDAFVAERKELFRSVDMRTYGRVKRYKRDMERLTDLYLKAGNREDRDSIVGLMFSTRDRLLEDLDNTLQ